MATFGIPVRALYANLTAILVLVVILEACYLYLSSSNSSTASSTSLKFRTFHARTFLNETKAGHPKNQGQYTFMEKPASAVAGDTRSSNNYILPIYSNGANITYNADETVRHRHLKETPESAKITENRLTLLNAISYNKPNLDKDGQESWDSVDLPHPDTPFKHPEIELYGPDVCNGSSPFLIAIVLSMPSHRLPRQMIRQTWGSVATTNSWPHFGTLRAPVSILFVVGHQNSTPPLDEVMLKEQKVYKDILLLNMTEHYRKLTSKMISTLHWIHQCCPGVKFVLKADEDTFVNMPLLVDYLLLYQQNLSRSILGNMFSNTNVLRTGKWGVSAKHYPHEFYPTYSSGSSYIISGDALGELLHAVDESTPISVEDAYITGILAKIAGINRYDSSALAKLGENRRGLRLCDFLRKRFAITDLEAEDIDKIWLALQMDYCRTEGRAGLDPLYKRPHNGTSSHIQQLKAYLDELDLLMSSGMGSDSADSAIDSA